jgi:GWxTD domain-containing protein
MKTRILTVTAVLLLCAVSYAAAQIRASREPFRITTDISRFRGADDSSLTVEIHYAIAQGGLTYRPDSAGWSAAADVTVLARTGDSLAFGDRWLVPHVVQDTTHVNAGINLVGVYPLQLPEGDFMVTLIGRDRNGPGRADSVTMRVPIAPTPTDKPTLSDIEFATSIRQGATSGPFFKNTLEVIPCVGGLFGEEQKAFYYVEAYGLQVGGSTADLTVRAAVYDAVGKELLSRERPKKRMGESAVLVDQFAVSALRSGTYTLVVSLLDTGTTSLARSGRKFFVYNPALGIDSTLLTSASSMPLPVYASMEESELDREFRWSQYDLAGAEKDQYGQLKGVDAKRKFLSDLWRRRPAGARDMYMARVAQANLTYASLGREGYRTDRGRVMIVYGTPDDYERHPNEQDTRPYEIWSYHSLQGGVIFVFVQRNQGGDYELVHSTHRDELHDDNWMRFAGQN